MQCSTSALELSDSQWRATRLVADTPYEATRVFVAHTALC